MHEKRFISAISQRALRFEKPREKLNKDEKN